MASVTPGGSSGVMSAITARAAAAHLRRCLLADPVDLQHDAGVAVECLRTVVILKAIGDSRDLVESQVATVTGRHDRDLRELRGPVAALLDPQQDLATAGFQTAAGQFDRTAVDGRGDIGQRQVIATQGVPIDFDLNLVITVAAHLQLGNVRLQQQTVA